MPIDREKIANGLLLAALSAGLYLTSLNSYLLFHSIAELFSILVAFSVFTIAWNARRYIINPYLLFVGVASLFIGALDLLHTLSYKGMAIFTDYDYYANQLWIAARYMESLTLLAAFYFLRSGRRPNVGLLLSIYTAATALLILSIFTWKVFPICFIEGRGQTPFKIYSEYAICLILSGSLALLFANRRRFERGVYLCVAWSIVFTMISELAFTFYVSNYGLSNLVGHYFKIFAFLLIYTAVVKTSLTDPNELIFRELVKVNRALTDEISARRAAEEKSQELITELTGALEEIRTLKGIIPICSYCKSVRTDTGYWERVEEYISARSEAEFTHGICPDCVDKHFPEYSGK